MRRPINLAIAVEVLAGLLASLALLAGCSLLSTTYETSELAGLVGDVVTLHERYVVADQVAADDGRAAEWLDQAGRLLDRIQQPGRVSSAEIAGDGIAVAKRVLDYLAADDGLDDVHRRVYRLSCELLIDTLD